VALGTFRDQRGINALIKWVSGKEYAKNIEGFENVAYALADPIDVLADCRTRPCIDALFNLLWEELREGKGLEDLMIKELVLGSLDSHGPYQVGQMLGKAPQDMQRLHEARWWAHYFGGGTEEATTLCAYLGRPKSVPEPIADGQKTRAIVQALERPLSNTSKPGLRAETADRISELLARIKDFDRRDLDWLERMFKECQDSREDLRLRKLADFIEGAVKDIKRRP
jgi:hypothetical protein